MQRSSCGPPALLLVEEGAGWDFTTVLPVEMSERIFGELDVASLGRASCTCRKWNDIIEGSEQLWRNQCLMIRAVCRREVEGDRAQGLSWKFTLLRNFTRSCVKRAWLAGRFSRVRSADELLGRTMTSLDVESWGEILQAELDR